MSTHPILDDTPGMGFSTGEWRAKISNAKAEKYAYDVARVRHMRYDRQMSNAAIAKELGISEGTVRNMCFKSSKWKTCCFENRIRRTGRYSISIIDRTNNKSRT